jgi:cobalt-zinc-cadmium resistance protein CzcA
MSVVPGVSFAFSQPIEMRFNELMTGVRSDVAIKIYGDDLDVLFEQGNDAAGIIGGIQGAADINVEQITGLPQMVVEYERNKIAQYGLAIEDVNQAIQTAFSGGKSGVVFEGERRFDLVVRLQEPFRQDIQNLRDLYISLPNGEQVPLEQIAKIGYQEGPAQISRDDTRRRIVVGVNVRDRDVESLVNEIRSELEANLALPAGYYVTYGGAFENLQRAKDRLSIAVPIALGLIFLLLYFTFSSIKETLMVFTAIPLAAIGGVFALWIRDIPFSISAGVGFIALFGIAVLNGIILISFFKQLKEDGVTSIDQRILQGTRQRLRPVLLTAFTDALGFLPMALSTSAGAEVQRPLATVVIGGLISATLLTLVVLPVLYRIFDEKTSWSFRSPKFAAPVVLAVGLMLGANAHVFAQFNSQLTLDEAIESALQNNLNMQAASERVKSQQALSKSRIDIGNTEFFYSRSEYDSDQNLGVESFGIGQELPFPTEFINQRKVGNAEVDLQEAGLNLTKNELIKRVRKAYYQVAYGHQQVEILNELREVYKQFIKSAELRYETGEAGKLELTGARSRYQNIEAERMRAESNLGQYYSQLRRWIYANDSVQVAEASLEQLAQEFINGMNSVSPDTNPGLSYLQEQSNVAQAELGLQRSQWLPDLNLQYKKQEVAGTDGFYGIHIGLKIPLWFTAQHQRTKAARLESKAMSMEVQDYRFEVKSHTEQLQSKLEQLQVQIEFYQNEQNMLAEELMNTAQKSFEAGEINYVTYVNYLDEATQIKQNYQQVLLEYLQQVAEWQYLNGQ